MHTFRSHWAGGLIGLSVLTSGCGLAPASRVVAIVGRMKITQTAVDNATRSNEVIQNIPMQKSADVSRAQIEASAEQQWIVAWALNHHITTMARAMTQAGPVIRQYFHQLSGTETLNVRLLDHHLSLGEFSTYVANQEVINAAYRQVTKNVRAPTTSEAYQYYLSNKNFYLTPQNVLFREITVPKRAKALSLLRELQAGASFSALATRDSVDQARSDGGSRGFVPLDATAGIPVGWVVALSEMSPGQMSIVKARLGYSIIEVQASRAGVAIPFSTVQPEITGQLMQQAKENAFDHWAEGRVKGIRIMRA